jgi:4,5-dihydroxyphthalate decarboxylase
MALRLTLAFPDYARLAPIALGDVRPDGIDLTWVRGPRPQMLGRVLVDPAVHGGEHSLAQHLYRIAVGDRSHVAIPTFPLRNFGARDIYVRRDSRLSAATDLIGKRVGMYSWHASGSIWYRHLLDHLDVPVDRISWTIGPIDDPAPAQMQQLPDGIEAAPEGRSLGEMLRAGTLDAIISPLRPGGFDVDGGALRRLLPDFRWTERGYFQATGCFPPQHLVILRRAVWERDRWVLQRLQSMFEEAERRFTAGIRLFPYASPWLEADLDETERLMGPDYHAHGLERNREQIRQFCERAHRAKLVPRVVGVDELFEEYLAPSS